MGIIGVVAALTLPNLNSSTGDKEKVAKVKKIYSNFEDAFGRAIAVYGPMGTWFNNDTTDVAITKRAAERITEFMKISKSCANNTNAGCMNTGAFSNLGGTHYVVTPLSTDSYSYILADGTSLVFNCSSLSCSIYFDIDGPNKGKFLYGSDVFDFSISVSESEIFRYTAKVAMSGSNCRAWSLYCMWWVLETDNMDYLKVGSSGKCPDGKTVLDGTSNITCK